MELTLSVRADGGTNRVGADALTGHEGDRKVAMERRAWTAALGRTSNEESP
jgi:hypothetical protein